MSSLQKKKLKKFTEKENTSVVIQEYFRLTIHRLNSVFMGKKLLTIRDMFQKEDFTYSQLLRLIKFWGRKF